MKEDKVEKGLTEGEELDDLQDEDFIKETEKLFENIWKELKEDAKELSKKELAKQMFVSGALMARESFDRYMKESFEKIEHNPEKIQELLKELQLNFKNVETKKDDLWEEGYFAETMGPKDIKERMRTFHMKHDEEMNYNCKKCNKKISAHNKDWHDGMCDDCFDETHYRHK